MNGWVTALISVVGGVTAAISWTVTAYVLYRSKNAELLAKNNELIAGELEIYKDKTIRLENENKRFIAVTHEQAVEIEGLKARTDVTELKRGQAAIQESIAKQSAAILENQNAGMALGHHVEKVLTQLVTTLEKMEKRLDRGLIMK